jgi:hypothetical protein
MGSNNVVDAADCTRTIHRYHIHHQWCQSDIIGAGQMCVLVSNVAPTNNYDRHDGDQFPPEFVVTCGSGVASWISYFEATYATSPFREGPLGSSTMMSAVKTFGVLGITATALDVIAYLW